MGRRRKYLRPNDVPAGTASALDFTQQKIIDSKLHIKRTCQGCGEIKWVTVEKVRNSSRFTGLCHACSAIANQPIRTNRQVPKKPKGDPPPSCGPHKSNVMHVYTRYKVRSNEYSREFDIPIKEFERLTSSPCHYCGALPQTISDRRPSDPYLWNGLDRVDSNKGYTIDNVVPCCTICNRAKNDMQYEDFVNWLDQIADFR